MKTQSLIFFQILVCALILSACGGGSSNNEQAPERYTISINAGVGGAISPMSAVVDSGNVAAFTVTPEANFSINSISGCGGNLSGSTYTTGAITTDCTVTASFVDNSVATYSVTTVAGAGGSISPDNATVDAGDNASFTVTPDAGFVISGVAGCNGSLLGSTYTTGAVTADCTVTATFVDNSVTSYTVTSTAGVGGSISPASVVVNESGSTIFSVLPNAGFAIDSVSGCNGSLAGDTYATGAVTADCSVAATFVALIPPVANAGSDQTVDENTPVILNGSATDSDGSIVGYSWVQLSGPAVSINNSLNAIASFDAPEVNANQEVVLQLTVTDNDGLTDSATTTITIENIVDNSVAIIAATGMPAAGFSDGFIYSDLGNPSIGDSGHVAFFGEASLNSGKIQALWAGLPDNLSVVIKENDTLPNLPANVLYSSGMILLTEPVVSNSGHVAFVSTLKGAVSSTNNIVLLAEVNGVLSVVARTGDQAVGFPSGYTYLSIGAYSFSDAGLVFATRVFNAATNQIAYGVWYWDFNELTLIAASESPGVNNFTLPQESPSIFANNCLFDLRGDITNTYTFRPQINNAGDVVFRTMIGNGSSTDNCPDNHTLFKWSEGVYTALASDGDEVPSITGSYLYISFSHFALQDNGDVSMYTRISDGSVLRPLFWVFKANGDQEYIAIGLELLPGASTEVISNSIDNHYAPYVDSNGNYLVGVAVNGNPLEQWLVKGQSRPLPYDNLSNIGASQLEKLLKTGDMPPDFPPTAYIQRIDLEVFANGNKPSMNLNGDVIFNAILSDAATPQIPVTSMWHINSLGELKLLLEAGDVVTVNGVDSTITSLPLVNRGVLGGAGGNAQHSDNGQVITLVRLSSSPEAIVLVTP